MTEISECHRSLSNKGRHYRYCGKPATWIANDRWDSPAAGGGTDREYGLCDDHLAEMKETGLLSHPELLRRVTQETP